MKIAEKRKAGGILERGGISQRIIVLATQIANGSYKDAIELAGQIHVLVDAASYDDYWDSKAGAGKLNEGFVLQSLIAGEVTRDNVISQRNPYNT